MLSEVAKAFPGEEAWAKSVSRRDREGGREEGREGGKLLVFHIYTSLSSLLPSPPRSLPRSLPPSTAQALGLGGGLAPVRGVGRLSSDEGHERFEGDSAFDHADGVVILLSVCGCVCVCE
jgi:hypothetical protein